MRGVIDRGMPSMRDIPSLNEVEDGKLRLGVGAQRRTIDEFALERCEEALAHRVFVTITDRAH